MTQHEEDMELSFAIARSKDKTCGICMEVCIIITRLKRHSHTKPCVYFIQNSNSQKLSFADCHGEKTFIGTQIRYIIQL